MAKRKKEHEEEGGGAGMERWLLSYADFITLLMVFFVIMYSMSRVDVNKYSAMAHSLSMVLSGQPHSIMDFPGPAMLEGNSGRDVPNDNTSQMSDELQMEEVLDKISDYIQAEDQPVEQAQARGDFSTSKLSDQIIIYEQERGLVISFKDSLLFESGSSRLTQRAEALIQQVGIALQDIPNYIRVEGHTDNLPINTAEFPSNWELSVLRAANVVHILSDRGGLAADRISVIGYGEYRPLVPNEDNTTRAINRRVDIVILKKKYDYFETSSVNDSVQVGQ